MTLGCQERAGLAGALSLCHRAKVDWGLLRRRSTKLETVSKGNSLPGFSLSDWAWTCLSQNLLIEAMENAHPCSRKLNRNLNREANFRLPQTGELLCYREQNTKQI